MHFAFSGWLLALIEHLRCVYIAIQSNGAKRVELKLIANSFLCKPELREIITLISTIDQYPGDVLTL